MNTIFYEELMEWGKKGITFQLIDVREPEEHNAFNIGGQLIPLGEIMQKKHLLQKELPIVFYCRKSIRSQIAIQRLRAHFPETTFYNLLYKNGSIDTIRH